MNEMLSRREGAYFPEHLPLKVRQLDNSVSHYSLTLQALSLNRGKAQIRLRGTHIDNGADSECDEALIYWQIALTARQFPSVRNVEVFLNGTRITAAVEAQ